MDLLNQSAKKLLFFLFPALISFCANSLYAIEFDLQCMSPFGCEEAFEKLKNLKPEDMNQGDFNAIIEDLKKTGQYAGATIDFSKNKLSAKIKPLTKVDSVVIDGETQNKEELIRVSHLQNIESLTHQLIAESTSNLVQYLKNIGYKDPQIELDIEKVSDFSARIIIKVDAPTRISWEEVKIEFSEEIEGLSEKYLLKKITPLLETKANSPKNILVLDSDKIKLKTWFNSLGYYKNSIEIENYPLSKNDDEKLGVKFIIATGTRYSFGFFGDLLFNRARFLEIAKTALENSLGDAFSQTIVEQIKKEYQKIGYHFPTVRVTQSTNRKYGIHHIRFWIDKGEKVYLDRIEFDGNQEIDSNTLEEYLLKLSNPPIQLGYYHEDGLEEAVEGLVDLYRKNGFLLAKTGPLTVQLSKNKKHASALVTIREGAQTVIGEINIQGARQISEPEILKTLNKVPGEHFDVISLESELQKIKEYYASRGYLEAKILNEGQSDLVSYSSNYRVVNITIKISEGEISRLGKIYTTGNLETKERVILRELDMLQEGEPITPSLLRKAEQALIRLGLFKSVNFQILKYNPSGLRDLLVKLDEHDPGSIEVGLGIRTDLGPRSFVEWHRDNIGGWNRSISFKGIVNRRFHYPSIDEHKTFHRQHEFLEFDLDSEYIEPWIGNTRLELRPGGSITQRHYNNFDAFILNGRVGSFYRFNDLLTGRLTYNYENIEQKHAPASLSETDNGRFIIGGITPSVTLDTTNNLGHPTKGFKSTFEVEWAAPHFFSQSGDGRNKNNPKINFTTLTLKNSFYVTPWKWLTFATAIRGGYQRNNVRESLLDSNGDQQTLNGVPLLAGFIPTIKVFRLGGRDSVRGFQEDAVNRDKIDNVRVQNAASFLNFKFEPRTPISENFVLGVFMDGGQVFLLDSGDTLADLDQLYWTYGISLRYVTPIGPLSFDFGIQTQDSKHENAFHISIGTF